MQAARCPAPDGQFIIHLAAVDQLAAATNCQTIIQRSAGAVTRVYSIVSIDGHLARLARPGPSTMRPRHEAAQPDVARQTSCSCWAALRAEIIAQH
jgi:hypothetical protein